MRIFAVKKEDEIGRDLHEATSFENGAKLSKSKSAGKPAVANKKSAQKA